MDALTVPQINDWHVYVDGEWLTISYDGYAPVNAWVGDRLHPITYRHMARGCDRAVCRGIHADVHAQYGMARH